MRPGRFGKFGGRFAPDTLIRPLEELESAYAAAKEDASFQGELQELLQNFVGRETPLYHARRLSVAQGGAQIYLKREDLAHTGAHKINNAVGQILLARRLGKTRIVAETGAGQHGVATAAAAAHFGLSCVIYMGSEDIRRQSPNVKRMKLMGAQVIAVESGSRTLKDAVSEAMRDWVTNFQSTYYLLGSALGPHPYPTMVRDFQATIGFEARAQILRQTGRLPTELIACVGGGSNAIGLFHAFQSDTNVLMTGVEAGGKGFGPAEHAARMRSPSIGVFQGTESYVFQDGNGQVQLTHSISAGLDYAAVGPEHAHLHSTGRARYVAVNDQEALNAFFMLSNKEGIIPALESSHAVAFALERARALRTDDVLLVNLSGRGDKDLDLVEMSI